MDHYSNGIHRIFERPAIYEWFQKLLGARAARTRFSQEFLRPFAGAVVLDIGCGVGTLLDDLPADVEYVGFDLNSAYIAAARRRYGNRGRFYVARVGDEQWPDEVKDFDLIVAKAILHHLGDHEAHRLLAYSRRLLRPEGVFVSMDPAMHDSQSFVARMLISMDRGRRVRTPEAYRRLLDDHFRTVEAQLVTDLLRLPYSHYTARAMA